jgi:uncharacterized protein DUF5666
MRNLTFSLIVAIAVMGGFYTGFRYEKSKVPDTSGQNNSVAAINAAGTGAGATRAGAGASPSPGAGGVVTGGAGGFGRGTLGTISSISGNTLTIKDAQGNDVKVQLDSSTTVTKTVSGSVSDLAQGINVTVIGQRTADGTITATAITIVPARTTSG